MRCISKQTFDEERALYGSKDVRVVDCVFDGPADGESAFKESENVEVERCYLNLRYPFWHDHHVVIRESEMTSLCRAALWYSDHIDVSKTKMHGIKALRECHDVTVRDCDVVSPEFGWFSRGLTIEGCTIESEYLMMRSSDIRASNMTMRGKYSFQYIENAVFEHCQFDTKDAFWHAKNVVVRDSVVKGEYLAWYCDGVTFERCTITGTQPFCYCKGLRLVDCKMVGTDLAFEKSSVEASITTPVDSIKNPYSGRITVPAVGQLIIDDDRAKAEVIITGDSAPASAPAGDP